MALDVLLLQCWHVIYKGAVCENVQTKYFQTKSDTWLSMVRTWFKVLTKFFSLLFTAKQARSMSSDIIEGKASFWQPSLLPKSKTFVFPELRIKYSTSQASRQHCHPSNLETQTYLAKPTREEICNCVPESYIYITKCLEIISPGGLHLCWVRSKAR